MQVEQKQVGPFVVKALNVDEGIDLMTLASDGDTIKLQKELIRACVTKDGQPINGTAFKELMPFVGEVVKEAMRLNGFTSQSE